MTLDDMSCLLHMSIRGYLLEHTKLIKPEGFALIVELLGCDNKDADQEVARSKGAHAQFKFFKLMFKAYVKEAMLTKDKIV
jgi:hypothetical protein